MSFQIAHSRIRGKSRLLGTCGLLAVLVASPDVAIAQGDKPKASRAAEEPIEREERPRGRLPNLFGKLGISDAQRGEIYELQATYDQQIDDLLTKIEKLRSDRDAAIVSVLTPGQRQRLQELKLEAARLPGEAGRGPSTRP